MMEPRHNNTTNNNCVHFQRPTFLPMLCSKPSIKNVILPSPISHQNPSSLTHQQQQEQEHDPLSPKISCIGQVKRSNKIISFPTTTTTTTTPNNTTTYFKLKRLFSAPTTVTVKPSSRGRKRREGLVNENKRVPVIDVVDLDPPLPVFKKKNDVNGDKAMENLWKRRSGGGIELKSLQIRINGVGDEQIKMKVTTV